MSTLGADPEFFIIDKTGEVVSSIGLIGGTKEKPKPLPIGTKTAKGFAMQEDNILAEINIPYATSVSVFIKHIRNARQSLTEYLNKNKDSMLMLGADSSRLVPHSVLSHPKAQMFGCDPDYDAYSDGGINKAIDPSVLKEQSGAWRFAGGHLHLGYNAKVPPFVAANLADVFIGLQVVSYDLQGKRRAYYGQAGRFRPKPYGIEYRTLSNFWTHNDSTVNYVAKAAFTLLEFLETKTVSEVRALYKEIPWIDVKNAINHEDYHLSSALVSFLDRQFGIFTSAGAIHD